MFWYSSMINEGDESGGRGEGEGGGVEECLAVVHLLFNCG